MVLYVVVLGQLGTKSWSPYSSSLFQAIELDDEDAFQQAIDRLKETPHGLDVIKVQRSVLSYNGEPQEHGMCLLAYAGYYKRIKMVDKLFDERAGKLC